MTVPDAPTAGLSPGAFLGALAGLDGMGPARLSALLGTGAADSTWEHIRRGTIGAVVGGLRGQAAPGAGGGDRREPFEDQSSPARELFPDRVLDSWVRQARSTPHHPEAMEQRITALGLFAFPRAGLPDRLRDDPDPPAVLFSTSPTLATDRPRVAIVGTRKASEYGLRTAMNLGKDLAAVGVEVISGLALGIDAAAHAGALDRGPGPADRAGVPVVAVIGAGHDRPCPVRNRALSRAVRCRGTIVSEVPPGVGSAPWRYPVRNRLIAALADVVVVVESASSGGSMSTVAEALARDRVVMAVPGAVGRRTAEGCHDLLRDGAEICTGAPDVVSALGLLGFRVGPDHRPVDGPATAASGDEPVTGDREPTDTGATPEGGETAREGGEAILELLCDGPATLDSLLSRSGLELSELSRRVSALELTGLVATGDGWVRRLV